MKLLLMSLLSKSCVYGLRAEIYVAIHTPERAYVPIREIAKELNLSFHFLTKIFQTLTEDGLLKSYRGPSGGVALGRPAQQVTLLDIVHSLEGRDLFRECILGLAHCGERRPCPLHKAWADLRGKLQVSLADASLKALADQVDKGRIRLGDA